MRVPGWRVLAVAALLVVVLGRLGMELPEPSAPAPAARGGATVAPPPRNAPATGGVRAVDVSAPPAGLERATVVRVVDGDTVDVRRNGRTERLRLIGIDTPESVDPGQPVECFGPQASAQARALMAGQSVRLESDPSQGERDQYDRLLRYVWLEDGRLVNLELLRQGYAREYTYQQPYRYQDPFRRAERTARQEQRGLWAPGACATGRSTPVHEIPPAPQVTNSGDIRFDPRGADRDCAEFSSQAEAQAFFQAARAATGQRDRHRLDADGDGVVCERLP